MAIHNLESPKSREIRELLEASPGRRINAAIGNLNVSIQILLENSMELTSAIRTFENPDNALNFFSTKNREDMEQYMLHIRRFLHNYLASVKSCVDTNRVIIRELYADHPFFEEYSKRVKQSFAQDPLVQFVQQLRNYALHRAIPMTSATLTYKRGEALKSSLLLHTAPLKESGIWNEKAREWLADAAEQEPILPLVEAYDSIAKEFFEWLGESQNELHKGELEEWRALVKQYAELRRIRR